jgi:hypothetical protein
LVPLSGHVRHDDEEAPLQVAHEAWQATHVPCVPTSSTNVLLPGQLATHEPPLRKGVAVAVQLRHWLADAPLHVPHAASHGSQTDDALAYLPTGVHDARHAPLSGLKKGVAVAQRTQSESAGPVHVAHDEWHSTQVSAADDEPPEHV